MWELAGIIGGLFLMALCITIAGGPTIGAIFLAFGMLAIMYTAFSGLLRFLRWRLGDIDETLIREHQAPHSHQSPK
jgi:hypothetical protein